MLRITYVSDTMARELMSQKAYLVQRSTFLLKYLESIVFLSIFATDMRRTEITNSIKEALKSVPYKMEARLYGSEARGDARPFRYRFADIGRSANCDRER